MYFLVLILLIMQVVLAFGYIADKMDGRGSGRRRRK